MIGATAAYGVYLAALNAPKKEPGFSKTVQDAVEQLRATRPTAINLAWALERQMKAFELSVTVEEKIEAVLNGAQTICDEEEEACRLIGEKGLALIKDISERKNGEPVNVLTHCNAG